MKYELDPVDTMLEDNQRVWFDLSRTKPQDRNYPADQERLKQITGQPNWQEPTPIRVKNIAGFEVSVDGVKIKNGQEGFAYSWQLRSLARWIAPVVPIAPTGAQTEPQTTSVETPESLKEGIKNTIIDGVNSLKKAGT